MPSIAALSLLLAGIAVVVLWVRSYQGFKALTYNAHWPAEQRVRTFQLKSYAGRAELNLNRTTTNRADYFEMLAASFPPGWHHIRDATKLDFSPALFDFEWKYDESTSLALRERASSWRVVTPYWFILTLVLAYPSWQALARAAPIRRPRGGGEPLREELGQRRQ